MLSLTQIYICGLDEGTQEEGTEENTLAFNPDHNDYHQYCCQIMTQDVIGIPSEAVNSSRLTAL